MNKLTNLIKENPIASVIIAGFAGGVIGAFISKQNFFSATGSYQYTPEKRDTSRVGNIKNV